MLDVLIIGGGPAGASAALLLARAGRSVAVVEKSAFPRRKVCGEYVAAPAASFLRSVGVPLDAEMRRIALWAGERVIEARLPAPYASTLAREDLDTQLLELAARAGAVVFQPLKAVSLTRTASGFLCQTPSIKLQARTVIAAHGSWEPGTLPTQQRRAAASPADLLALKAHFRGTGLSSDTIALAPFHGGYGGVLMLGDGRATYACCLRRDALESLRQPGLTAGESVHASSSAERVASLFYETTGADRLFAHHPAQAAQAARRRAHGGVDHRQRRGVGHRPDHAAHRAHPAGGRRADARHPELVLARVRQPGGLLALHRNPRRAEDQGGARHQRHRGARLRADLARGAGARLGVHGPRLYAAQHAEGGERARRHRPHRRGDPRLHRQAPARLARAGPDRDLAYARPAGRGRLRVRRRLGARRPAGGAQDAHQADRQHPVHAGMQRRGDDADPAPRGGRVLPPRHRPVRADLRRLARLSARDGPGRASLHHGRGAPREVLPARARGHAQARGRAVLDR